MRSRRSRAAALEHDIVEAGSRAAETIGDLAEHAIAIARDAGHAARPTVQLGAESLGRAFERAAGAFADTADHLAGENRMSEVSQTARIRLADASERFARSIRPQKRRTHRVRRLIIAAAVVGGIVALVQSPLRGKIQERIFGPAPGDEELPPITLPSDQQASVPDYYPQPAEVEDEQSADIRGSAGHVEQTSPEDSTIVDPARS